MKSARSTKRHKRKETWDATSKLRLTSITLFTTALAGLGLFAAASAKRSD